MKLKLLISMAACSLFAFAQIGAVGQSPAPAKAHGGSTLSSLNKQEMELLLADVGKKNPKVLERLASDPDVKMQQIENLKQMLAFASQAQREGLASDETNRQELENIRAEIIAVSYDEEINKGKGPLPPFSAITEPQVTAYWADKTSRPLTHEAEFNDFLNAKIAILKANDPANDREITDEEKAQARDVFARTRIYKTAYEKKARAGLLTKSFLAKTDLQVKLQQAQFLSRLYAQKAAEQTAVSDADIAAYVRKHPELDTTAKRATAEKLLARAKTGEDFATLANEFSEDPGNKDENGAQHGGLYSDVAEGQMIPSFEHAALALEPGQIAPEVVESDFGYHIIKLEKKSTGKDPSGKDVQVYDVRHILISTMHKDPANPTGRELPVTDYVRSVLETDRNDQLVQRLEAENHIQVADDFAIPTSVDDAAPAPAKKNSVGKKRPARKRRH